MTVQTKSWQKSKPNKFYKPLLILALFTVFVISTTTAYFTSSSQSDENVFSSGDLQIDVTQNELLTVSNWRPGDTYQLEFKVTNTGTLAQFFKGYLSGSWSDETLGTDVFQIVKVERKLNGDWQDLVAENITIGDEFYFSSDGTNNTLLGMDPGKFQEYRLTVKLSDQTGDEYQNQVFSTSLHVAAKQVDASASWPETY